MLPDTPQVAEVLFGENGAVEGLGKGKTLIDMSSISPIETKEFAKKSALPGLNISTRRYRAARSARKMPASPSWLAAREQALMRRCRFSLMGKNITLVGDCGDGQTTKVANQIIVALNIEAVAEALVLPQKRVQIRPGCAKR